MAESNIELDLDRAINDPIYRRKVIERLKRRESETQEPEPSVEDLSRPSPGGTAA